MGKSKERQAEHMARPSRYDEEKPLKGTGNSNQKSGKKSSGLEL